MTRPHSIQLRPKHRNRCGAALMEYVILAFMIGGSVVLGVQTFGDTVRKQLCLATHSMVGDPSGACDHDGTGPEGETNEFPPPTGPQVTEITRIEVTADAGVAVGVDLDIKARVTGEMTTLDNGQRIFRVTRMIGAAGGPGDSKGIKVDAGDIQVGLFGTAQAQASGAVGIGNEYEIPPGMSQADFLLWLNATAAGYTFDQFGILGFATKWWIGSDDWPEQTAVSVIMEGGLSGELSGIAGVLDLPLGPHQIGPSGAALGGKLGTTRTGEMTAYSNGEIGFAISQEGAISVHGMLGINNGTTADVHGGSLQGQIDGGAELIYDPATGQARIEATQGVWSPDGNVYTENTVVIELNRDLRNDPPGSLSELMQDSNVVSQNETIYDVETDDYGVNVAVGVSGSVGAEVQILRPRP